MLKLALQQSATTFAVMLLLTGSTLADETAKTNPASRQQTLATHPTTRLQRQILAQATSTDVKPTDWAFQALQSLGKRYGCPTRYADGTYLGNRSLTRFELATALNTCLDRINEVVATTGRDISKEDLATVQRLQQEFSAELATMRGRVDALESRSTQLEADQFSARQQANRPFAPRAVAPPVGDISISPNAANFGTIRPPSTQGSGTFFTENYNPINDNPFLRVNNNPLSTFSIDVDAASYSNIRRLISNGQLPPKDAVRIEELINYFTYNYPQPERDRPFSLTTEISAAPWNPQHKLVHIGLQGKSISKNNLPPSNLVFLLDVSGSMDEPNKLPLVKSALRLLVNELTAKDRVTIVVYAGAAGLVLPPTPGNQKDKILDAIENLQAGGSTAGGAGIQLAYKVAKENFIQSGNNRVILATDGDFNIGISSDAELVRLIEEKRNQGVYLTVLGFGTGNLKDSKMEQLANKGNGNYAYIDNIMEARKVLVSEIGATLLTIAKDVKIQVEFNPAKVQAYRLIGYENRLLREQDFNDDTKDAGELGAGHSVTALYEIIPVGVESDVKLPEVDSLRYQQNTVAPTAYASNELMQVKLRYKAPNDTTSQLIAQSVVDRGVRLESSSENFKFAAAVAAFGMIVRDSEYRGVANFEQVLSLASQSKGEDKEGYRAEFIRLVEHYRLLANVQN